MSAFKMLYDSIPDIRFNPALIVRRSLSAVEETLDGQFDLVDPTNPFMMLLEGNATLAAAAMTDGESVLRKMYESMSLNEDELYLHMSDKDYLNRFATPARATISLLLDTADIEKYAELSTIGNYRKIVIPKHTQFTAADLVFTMQHAIEIRIKQHGGYDVVYNVEDESPVETLTSNVVDFGFTPLSSLQSGEVGRNYNFLHMRIRMSQFKITSQPGQLTLAANYKKSFSFTDQFYYARAYRTVNGRWEEMRTTHTDQVFDPRVPTAVFKVTGNVLTVSVPQIYVKQGQMDGEMRIDIYTTKGEMDIDMSALNPNAFSVMWRDLDGNVDSRYYSPLSNMTMTMFADGKAVGGRDSLTFTELRDRVMTNSVGEIKLPITNVQAGAYLQNLGYSVVTDVDNVTNRNFLATRLLPIPPNGPVVSSAGLAMETLSVTQERLTEIETVADNGERMTILPTTVYTTKNGITEIVPQTYVTALQALPFDTRVEQLNKELFTFSPFHYVLDSDADRFEIRPYYLEDPKVTDKNFILDNDTAGLSVATRRYDITKTPTGYRLTIEVNGDDTWKALDDSDAFCQLAFRPEGEIDLAYMNGTMIGLLNGNRVYQFDITTNYDVDVHHNLALTSFSMYNNAPNTHFIPLKGVFYVLYAVSGLNPSDVSQTTIDLDLNLTNLPNGTLGITEETLNIRLGSSLSGLWRASRSVPSSLDYRRHTVDVPALYKQNVYNRDGTGAKTWSVVDDQIVFDILHHVGDPILDQNDDPTYEFRVGDVVLDQDGNPVIENTRRMQRQLDILTVDGVYYFTTELSSTQYRDSIAELITEWVSVDIASAQERLLEQSKIYFYPKVSLGYVNALVLDNKEVKLRSNQAFRVTYYVNATVYRDTDLRVSLTVAARMAINEALQQPVVTTDGLIEAIRARVGNDVIGIVVNGLGGDTPYDSITMVDDAARLSIGKRTIAHADGTVGIEDAVDVAWIRHTA